MFSFRANPTSYSHCQILFRCLSNSWLQIFLWAWPLNPNLCQNTAEGYRKPSSEFLSSLKMQAASVKENLESLGKVSRTANNNGWSSHCCTVHWGLFFLQAGWHSVCFINTIFLCLHFPQKKSIKRALLLMLDKQEAFTSSFYGHSHVSSAVLMMEACATIVSVN